MMTRNERGTHFQKQKAEERKIERKKERKRKRKIKTL